MNRFKKKALRVITEHLSVEEVEVIREMFNLMDIDNDGKVTYEELRSGLRKVGSQLAEPEIKLIMDVVQEFLLVEIAVLLLRLEQHCLALSVIEADVDGNGVLDYGEFVAVTTTYKEWRMMLISAKHLQISIKMEVGLLSLTNYEKL